MQCDYNRNGCFVPVFGYGGGNPKHKSRKDMSQIQRRYRKAYFGNIDT